MHALGARKQGACHAGSCQLLGTQWHVLMGGVLRQGMRPRSFFSPDSPQKRLLYCAISISWSQVYTPRCQCCGFACPASWASWMHSEAQIAASCPTSICQSARAGLARAWLFGPGAIADVSPDSHVQSMLGACPFLQPQPFAWRRK